MVSRKEYENEINRLQDLINLSMQKRDELDLSRQNNMKSLCRGMDFGECDKWKKRQWDERTIKMENENALIEKYKQQIWDYQKQVAQEEQEAQIKAVRDAISQQVRIEQEKLKQQKPITIQETVIPEPRIIEPPKRQTENNLLPLAVVAGVLLL